MLLEDSLLGGFVGRQGKTVQALQKRTGCKIDIRRSASVRRAGAEAAAAGAGVVSIGVEAPAVSMASVVVRAGDEETLLQGA